MADNKNLEKKEVSKDKKEGLGKKISKFFREYRSELKKISWPTFPEVLKNSLVTIAVVVIVGLFIWAVDSVLTLGRDAILKVDSSDTLPGDFISSADIDLEEINEKIEYYGLDSITVSASDYLSDSDYVRYSGVTSSSDIVIITAEGVVIDGYKNYVSTDAASAASALASYAATLADIPVSETDIPNVSDTNA